MELAFILIAFVIGIVGGFFIGNSSNDAAQKLEAELKGVQDELNQYRSEVTSHFARTAELFNSITANYRALYHHLAEGAQKLCAVDTQLLGAMPKLEPLTAPSVTQGGVVQEPALVEGEKARADEEVANEEVAKSEGGEVQTALGEESPAKKDGNGAAEEAASVDEKGEEKGAQQPDKAAKSEGEDVQTALGEESPAKKDGNGAAEEETAKLAAASSVERSMEQAAEKHLH